MTQQQDAPELMRPTLLIILLFIFYYYDKLFGMEESNRGGIQLV